MKTTNPTRLQALNEAICRSPHFPIYTELKNAWPVLKRLIKASAPEFYGVIAELNYSDLADQPEKVRFSIWKYYNRSRYRSTPFGEFAAISLVAFGESPKAIQLRQDMDVYTFEDWSKHPRPNYTASALKKNRFRTNPLCYPYGEEYHYLYRNEKEFELNAIPQREDIVLVLEFCRSLRDYDTIAAEVFEQLDMTKSSFNHLLKQLLALQVLECEQQANITGKDYFQRIGLRTLEQPKYQIAGRSVIDGAIPSFIKDGLCSYAEFMSKCLPTTAHTALEKFKTAFLQLWEQHSVPLSLALDPILGIGYGYEGEVPQPSLVGALQSRPAFSGTPMIAFDRFEQFMMAQMIKGGTIQLKDYHPADPQLALPNTFNTIYHMFEGHPVIQHAGGATATSLLGRFTAIDEINKHACTLSGVEQSANPQIMFFDIAYQFEGRTDNVNRRRHLYETELNIGSWSTMERPLKLAEILVSIRTGEIVLHHKESGKRLIPRLASAYNHQRSDLDLFRFLCDLQYQGMQAQLSFDLQAMFPNLEHYPRVYYGDIIACPAKWKVPALTNPQNLKQWLEQKQLDQPFSVGTGDQTLVIDPKHSEDLHYLWLYLKQQKGDCYLTEALIDGKSYLTNEKNEKLHGQFIAQLYHREPIYTPYQNEHLTLLRRDLRLPGGEWLYMELYMRPEVMDEFLYHEVRPLLKAQAGLIKEWFFIRYNQPEPHLRLRLKMKDAATLSAQLQNITARLDIGRHYGRIKKFEVKSYEREILRYGEAQMEKVEHFFYLDSVWSLKQIAQPEGERYRQIMAFAQQLCSILYPQSAAQLHFFRQLSESFAAEMKFGQADYKRINQHYQGHNNHESAKSNPKLLHYFRRLISLYPEGAQGKLLADLIHMHINRRFNSAQRMHEAVIYQFLYKSNLAKQHIKKGRQV